MEKQTKICCACGVQKELKNFYKNNALPSGIERRCKICKMSQAKCPRTTPKRIPKRKKEFGLNKPSKEDYKNMYYFLKLIGYNPLNAHQEFCEKYGLKPKKRSKKNRNFFTPEDLNL